MYQLVTGGSSKNHHHRDIVAGLPTLKLMGEKCLAGGPYPSYAPLLEHFASLFASTPLPAEM
jgi:hypothetical protein